MKKHVYTNYSMFGIVLIIYFLLVNGLSAQTTINTNHVTSNGASLITFHVQNTNANAILLESFSCDFDANSSANVQLLYNTTAINNPGTWSTGTVGVGQNGWQLAVSGTVATLAGQFSPFSNIGLMIPAGATYSFAISSSGGLNYADLVAGNGINTFSGGGVNLLTGDGISWGGGTVPTTPSNYPRGFVGGITFIPAVPCAGAPLVGTTTGPSNACMAQSVTLNVTGASQASGLVYQWQMSTTGLPGSWTDIAGATNASLITTINASAQYRRREICTAGPDTVYSTTHNISLGVCLNMGNSSATACSGTFFDSGGANGNYSSSENLTYVLNPTPGNKLSVTFNSFDLETCCDDLTIYDGPNNTFPLIGVFTSNPGTINATSAGGELTFVFQSDGSVVRTGWDATVNCVPNPPCVGVPVGGTTTGATNVCANANESYTVPGITLGAGITAQWQTSTSGLPGTWVDIAGATSSSYSGGFSATTAIRRRLICTTGPDTAYSVPLLVNVGQCINMQTGSFTLCSGVFYDNGGPSANYLHSSNQTLVLNPVLGNKLNVTFNSFDLETCCDNLKIYDGPNNTFPLLGTYTTNPGTINASSSSGALTFVFTSDGSVAYSGWNASIGCTPIPADEVELVSIDKPLAASCTLGSVIELTVANNGTNPLTSVDFSVNASGLVQNVSWTGNIQPYTSQQITLPGTFFFNDGDSLTVTASLPNGVADTDLTDNTKGIRHYVALQGVYKVGYGYNNTDTIADIPTALARLDLRGICDTVYFDLKSGIYNGRYTINDYPGWTSGLKVVFRSETGNAADVILTDSATSSATNFIFNLDGGDGIGFERVTLRQRSATYRTILNVKNGAHELFVNNSRLLCDTSLTASTTGTFDQIIIRSADGTTDHNATITNNFLQGGVRAINLGAATNEIEKQHIIRNNIIKNISYVGILVGGTENAIVENNEVYLAPYSTLSSSFGVYYLNTIKGGSISGNNVQLPRLGVPINLDNAKGGVDPLYVRNNFVYSGDSTTTSGSYGVLVQNAGSMGIKIVNNSIAHYSNSTSYGAITVLDGNSISILNNNIGSFKLSPGIKVDKAYSLVESNNNNIYQANGGNVVSYTNTSYATIADFTAATGNDAASISVNPGFTGTDLHTCQLALNGAAMPLAYITTDIDGDARSSTPDIGADEFMGDAGDLLAADAIDKCTNESVSLGNAPLTGATYLWSTGAATSSINTTTAGQFIVTASTACGSFSDTVTVSNIPNPTAGFTLNGIGLTAMLTNTSTNAVGYSWNFGDGNTSTLANPNHVYTAGGVYVITLTVYGECDTVTTTQTYNAIAVGNEELSIMDVSLYPNPATDQIQLVWKNGSVKLESLELYDVAGKVVKVIPVNDKLYNVNISLEGLQLGVYIVKYSTHDSFGILKFVKK